MRGTDPPQIPSLPSSSEGRRCRSPSSASVLSVNISRSSAPSTPRRPRSQPRSGPSTLRRPRNVSTRGCTSWPRRSQTRRWTRSCHLSRSTSPPLSTASCSVRRRSLRSWRRSLSWRMSISRSSRWSVCPLSSYDPTAWLQRLTESAPTQSGRITLGLASYGVEKSASSDSAPLFRHLDVVNTVSDSVPAGPFSFCH